MRISVSGAVGFIGSKIAEELLKDNHIIYGIDNLNEWRVSQLIDFNPEIVINEAARAGVRYSLKLITRR